MREAPAVAATTPPPTPTRQIAATLLEPSPPAFISDAMLGYLSPLRGESGKVRFTPAAGGATIAKGVTAPDTPGVYKLVVQIDQAVREIDNLNVITLVPFSEKERGRIGPYFLGTWPFEQGGGPRTAAYANPSGFIEVTPENADTYVSDHFRLRDFLTKDQPNVWPRYLLLNPKLLDRLELTIQGLEADGHPVTGMPGMGGFRPPQSNHPGGTRTGRATRSRHMYGDASDVFVDNDGNGVMDDLTGDGRVDARDAQVIAQAVERVERKFPSLVGGVGVYSACCGHGPFAHVDVRGFRARWQGT